MKIFPIRFNLQLDYLIKSISLGLCLLITNLLTVKTSSTEHYGGQFLLLLLVFTIFNYALLVYPIIFSTKPGGVLFMHYYAGGS